MDDSDLYGALLYIVLYGTFLLLSGKVFYGYIYGVAVFGTVALHLILSLMSPALDTVPTPNAADPTNYNPHHKPSMSGASAAGHFSATLTFPSFGAYQSHWYPDSHGYHVRLSLDYCRCWLVHIQFVRDVLRRRAYEWNEGSRGVSVGSILCCFWNYGYLLFAWHWLASSEDRCGLKRLGFD